MNKVYKDANEFFLENFPKSYFAYKIEQEESLHYKIEKLSEQLKKNIHEIMHGENNKARAKTSHASAK